MHKIFYQLPGTWFGDCMPFGKDREFYLYHQRDTRNPVPFGEPFGWCLSTTSDFVHYHDHGIAIPRGGDFDQDQFIFAGSVFEAEGLYHAFYTGYNRDYPKLGKASQVLMHAYSHDLLTWTKEPEALQIKPQPGYDPDDWRDPFVVFDAQKNEYLLILGARKEGPKTLQTGCTVKFTSKDLKKWDFQGEFWAPDLFTMHEMPDLFKIGDWWYHVISEYSDKNKTTYRMSKNIEGPWMAPKDDAFDGRAYYAARTFCLNGQRVLFGWVPTREDNDDTKNFEWGGTFLPHEICQRSDGSLGVKIPDSVWNAFPVPDSLEDVLIDGSGRRREVILRRECGTSYRLEADVKASAGLRSFGVRFYENESTGESCQYSISIPESKVVFEKNPNTPWFTCMNIGLERPAEVMPEREYRIRLIVDDTISTLYIDDIALSARFYGKPGNALGLFATDGKITVKNMTIATM